MKLIFIFSSTYPNYTGGIETWVYNVCQRLVKQHEITIFTIRDYRNEKYAGTFEKIDSNIDIVPVTNLNHVPGIRCLVHKHVALYNANITAYSMYREASKYLNLEETYYVIGLGTVFPTKTVRLLKKKYTNIKAISSCRGPEPEVLGEDYLGTGYFMEKLQRKNLEEMDVIWANGKDTQKILKRKGFESTVIKNGVDIEGLEKEEPFDYKNLGLGAETVLVTIGSVSKIKGYYEIIEAVSILKKEYSITVHFVGIGKVNVRNKNKFELYAENFEVSDQVHLIGEHRNVASYIKGADIVLCTSGGGGYGHAALEAMASGTPIVAWDNTVYKQMLSDGKSAKLVNAWDARALAEGIHYTIYHKAEAMKWGEQAKQAAQQFDWSFVIEEIEESLKKL